MPFVLANAKTKKNIEPSIIPYEVPKTLMDLSGFAAQQSVIEGR